MFVPKIKAYKVGDMKDAIMELTNSKNETEIISIRPGEKIHEFLINNDELRNTFENDDDYVIIDQNLHNHYDNLTKTTLESQYSSDKVSLLTKDEIKEILIKENLI